MCIVCIVYIIVCICILYISNIVWIWYYNIVLCSYDMVLYVIVDNYRLIDILFMNC